MNTATNTAETLERTFPAGLKPGDFIQSTKHFGDVFFEVVSCIAPGEGSEYWSVNYVEYGKYDAKPSTNWINCASSIRRVIPSEMAVPVMLAKRHRFHARAGQYDPFYGFAPHGRPMRLRDAA